MADNASTAYLKDKDKNVILPATDWSVVQNKPNNLVTADQLPKDTGWRNGDLMNGTTGFIKYRQIGHVVFMYAQIKDFPISTTNPNADNSAIGFPRYPDEVGVYLISDWVSMDGNAKAQVGFELGKGIMQVYRIEGPKSTIRFYKSFIVD